MRPFLSSSAMREADRQTIEEIGIAGATLMETAGREAVRALLEARPRPGAVGILCGKGNNGGDGLVMARVLADLGVQARVWLVSDDGLSLDAEAQLEILKRHGGASFVHTADRMSGCTVLVDALLGTGQAAAPRAPLDTAVRAINQANGFVVAIDVPTGLNADTGEAAGDVVRADLTVTMGAAKAGLLLGRGPDVAGRVVTAEIGIPPGVLAALSGEAGSGHLSDDAWVIERLPVRPRQAYKYSTGPTLVVGGSIKYPGAPVLAASAAARIGSGYVVCAFPEDATWTGPAEIPTVSQAAPGEWLERARAVLVGPGLGRGEQARDVVEQVLRRSQAPVVIDADGLRAASELGRLQGEANRILTPHAGEFLHMTGLDAMPENPVTAARTWAERWNAVLVLKGAPTVIADATGQAVICTAGTPALATAGTGDVLAGLCAGLLAMGLQPFEAAVCATHVGGACAERYGRLRAPSTMMAADLIRHLPLVLSERLAH
ncbi:MAG: NAD(P)H-hydrate dehydratase [Rhodothermales bacterium]|nr:NAD(P)H-hydrate dehydratase [Rhodothermales bacterium]MBO6778430.1 NAD(P)H-hydrate dehydratase [Rhodothermales bacterium]